MGVENFGIRNHERNMISHYNERHGLVTSYDPKTHLAKVTFMPDGEESGWLPIEESHIGNGWGMLSGLTPGSGQGDGQSGAGSGSGSGGSGQQYQGDQVSVRYQEGDLESGMIVRRIHSDVDRPPKVESGEMLFMHALGARMFMDKNGKFHIYDKTSNQNNQGQQFGQSGSGSGSTGSGGIPLKNAPPLQPQSMHIEFDGNGKMTITSYQQGNRQNGSQDPSDPTSQKSPSPYATHVIDGKGNTMTITTYQAQQTAQSGGGGGGSQASPDTTQGDPGSEGQGQTTNPFSMIMVDNNKKTMQMQTFNPGSNKPMHSILMDNQAGRMTHETYDAGGGKQSSFVLDTSGNIAHNCKGVCSINAPNLQFKGNLALTGDLKANNISASTVTSPGGSVPGPCGGSPGPAFVGGAGSPIASDGG